MWEQDQHVSDYVGWHTHTVPSQSRVCCCRHPVEQEVQPGARFAEHACPISGKR